MGLTRTGVQKKLAFVETPELSFFEELKRRYLLLRKKQRAHKAKGSPAHPAYFLPMNKLVFREEEEEEEASWCFDKNEGFAGPIKKKHLHNPRLRFLLELWPKRPNPEPVLFCFNRTTVEAFKQKEELLF